jgi:iron complex outermembrane recepter protein
MRYSQLILIPAVSFISSQALAQQTSGQALDEITVTAARAQRSIADVPQSAQVINQGEIEEQLKQSSSASAALSKLLPGEATGDLTALSSRHSTLPIFFTAAISRALSASTNFAKSGASR